MNDDRSDRLARGPISQKERALAPDLARGFMLLLVVLAHAPTLLFTSDPWVMNRPEGVHLLDRVINFIELLFVDNRARYLFAVLFGYGLVMVIENQLRKGTSDRAAKRLLRRRAWILILFGFVLHVFIGGLDILSVYGFSILLIGWLLFRPDRVLTRTLILVGLFYSLLMPFMYIHVANALGGVGFPRLFSATDTYTGIVLERLFSFPSVQFIHITTPMLLPILVGMWAGRKRLLIEPHHHRKQLSRIVIAGISISVIGGLPLALIGAEIWHPTPTVAGLVFSLHLLTGLAGGCGYAAIFGLIGAVAKGTGRATRSLAALGKRSLTFFVFNEAILVLILSPVALGLGKTLHSTGAAMVAVLIWLTSLGLAIALEKMKRRGSLDALFRLLVYWK